VNEQRDRDLVDSFLSGFADALDAMLSLVLRSEVNAVEACGPEMMPVWLGTYPVYAFTTLGRDAGLAVLMESTTALRLVAMLEGKDEPAAELNDEHRELLRGLIGDATTRGARRLLEDFGQPVAAPGEPEVSDEGEMGATALSAVIGTRFLAAMVTLTSDPGLAFDAMVLFSESMEQWAAPGGSAAPAGAVLTPEEMNDILHGFGGDAAPADMGGHMQEDVRIPANLDMVMDIRLRATARLGSVEMPLGDVLSFGPGSIIDVGRLVDEPVDLLVNNKLIARGDIVVVDEKYGLRITEIVTPRERIESLR
jgi:flagellar motor switch protein FliN/FliY